MKRICLLLTACLAAFASAVAGNTLTVNDRDAGRCGLRVILTPTAAPKGYGKREKNTI